MPLLVVKSGQYNLANFSWFAFCRRYHYRGGASRIARSLGCPTAQGPVTKIFRFIRSAVQCINKPVSLDRGADRDRHERRRCEMRWTLIAQLTSAREVDGEIVQVGTP